MSVHFCSTANKKTQELMSPVPALRNYTDSFATNVDRIESRLWKAADDLRANSNKNSSEYFEPVMGLLFLRHANNRYLEAKTKIVLPTRGGRARDLTVDDFTSQGALYLRPESQYDTLLNLPGG